MSFGRIQSKWLHWSPNGILCSLIPFACLGGGWLITSKPPHFLKSRRWITCEQRTTPWAVSYNSPGSLQYPLAIPIYGSFRHTIRPCWNVILYSANFNTGSMNRSSGHRCRIGFSRNTSLKGEEDGEIPLALSTSQIAGAGSVKLWRSDALRQNSSVRTTNIKIDMPDAQMPLTESRMKGVLILGAPVILYPTV